MKFTTPYEQYKEREGQECEIVREKDHATFDYEEVGAMYIIRFEDGEEIEAWPEELWPELITS